jgi:hypothetical protein
MDAEDLTAETEHALSVTVLGIGCAEDVELASHLGCACGSANDALQTSAPDPKGGLAMRNYDRINARPPAGIEGKRAHILGGGIAGLAAAAFLVDDAHVPAANVTNDEALDVTGGAMDAGGDAKTGYKPRGYRELHASHECLWYLCSKVPSIHTPGLTNLDETYKSISASPSIRTFG